MSEIERIIRDVLNATEVTDVYTGDNVDQLVRELTDALEEALNV